MSPEETYKSLIRIERDLILLPANDMNIGLAIFHVRKAIDNVSKYEPNTKSNESKNNNRTTSPST